jgi:hypothetical protein
MKFKTFEEYKDFDVEYSGDISEEYAKMIISEYIDKKDDSTLESVYAEIIKGDQLDEDQEIMIQESLTNYLKQLYKDSKKIRNVVEIDSNKFNI